MTPAERTKLWRQYNPDKVAVQKKRHHQKHKDRLNIISRTYYRENREQQLMYQKLYRTAHRVEKLCKQFNVTPDFYFGLLDKQENRCAVCRREFVGNPCVDHNHKCCPGATSCGKCVRGLLCNDCNLGLGNFKDNPDFLNNAILYLTQLVEV